MYQLINLNGKTLGVKASTIHYDLDSLLVDQVERSRDAIQGTRNPCRKACFGRQSAVCQIGLYSECQLSRGVL